MQMAYENPPYETITYFRSNFKHAQRMGPKFSGKMVPNKPESHPLTKKNPEYPECEIDSYLDVVLMRVCFRTGGWRE